MTLMRNETRELLAFWTLNAGLVGCSVYLWLWDWFHNLVPLQLIGMEG